MGHVNDPFEYFYPNLYTLQRSITTGQVLSLVYNLDFSERYRLNHWHYGTEQKFILIKRIHKIMAMTKQMAWKRKNNYTCKLKYLSYRERTLFSFHNNHEFIEQQQQCIHRLWIIHIHMHEFIITSKIVYKQLHTNTRTFIQLTSINYTKHSRTVKYKLHSALPNSNVVLHLSEHTSTWRRILLTDVKSLLKEQYVGKDGFQYHNATYKIEKPKLPSI